MTGQHPSVVSDEKLDNDGVAPPQRFAPTAEDDERPGVQALDLAEAMRIGFVALAAAAVCFRVWEPWSAFSLIGAVGLFVGGWPMLTKAAENLMERRMTMELSMTIAVVVAALIGEFFTALVITLFVLIAEVLEDMTVERGRRAISDLLNVLPGKVRVRRAGSVEKIPLDELQIGEVVLVDPGGRIAVDGHVVSGHSFVNQANVTGESMPVEKVAGAEVCAGTINVSGALDIKVERIGRDTSYGKIIEAVEQAERSRAPVQRVADRLAGYLIYFALAAAALTFLITGDIRATISVVIVAGACGIAAGTPLAILGGIGRAARLGSIIKGGVHLETLGVVDTVVLDKTGTLTFGEPDVQAVVTVNGHSEVEVLEAAGAAELRSEHPLGKAIVHHDQTLGLEPVEPEWFSYTPGRGISAVVRKSTILVGNSALMEEHGVTVTSDAAARLPEGSSDILVARDGRLLGAIGVADTVRPEARQAVADLRRMGMHTILLTGDTEAVSGAVARSLGVSEFEAGLLPDKKVDRIKALVAAGRTVAMVGDGVNDAPALVEANIGVAMGSGTDVARESGDVVLLGNDLSRFVDTVALARRTRSIILENFAGTIGVDVVGIGLAAFGLLGPLLAAFIHVASELAFVLNSTRLLSGRQFKRNEEEATRTTRSAGMG